MSDLCPRAARAAAQAGVACCDCATYVQPCNARILSCNAGVIQSMRAEAESLRSMITEQGHTISNLETLLRRAHQRANTAEIVLNRVRKALS